MNIPENIKAVIFDLDGLLIDSEPCWAEADKTLLEKRGFFPTDELFLRRLGTGLKQTVEIYKEEFDMAEDTESLMNERLELFFEKLEKNLILMTGAYKLITDLFNKHTLLAIATSGPYKSKIADIIKELEIDPYFSAVVTGEDVENAKPAPDIFLYASEKLKVSPEHCLVLEDAPNGVISGKAAGMTAYGVNKDQNIAEGLKKAGADKVFSSLSEITI